jgi:alpha-galactosidase
MTWILRLELDGQDAYPTLRHAAEDPTIFARDRVGLELLRQLGWFVRESRAHTAEYTPYFLHRDD